MKKVLVIGAKGLVGSRFAELAGSGFDIIAADREEIDITDRASVEKYFGGNEFDSVINLAAFTDVAAAEKETGNEEGLCWKLNASAPKYLAEFSKKYKRFLIHFSTDFVFEGLESSKGPFDEDDKLPDTRDNLCWYGWTKLLGEKAVRKVCKNSAIVRITYPFRSHYAGKADFARKIIELYDAGTLYPLFTDQVITPIFIDDLVEPLSKLIEIERPGIYHIASDDITTYYDFGNYLLEKSKDIKDVPQKASLVEFLKNPERNKRPIWGGFKTQKTQQTLGIKFKSWREMIDEFVSQL